MSNKDNAFMASAKKSQREQAVIQTAQVKEEKLVGLNIRIPESMRNEMRLHYAKTGESQTALIRRLLEAEFRG